MHYFESCLSLEKLVFDAQLCDLTRRLVAGLEPREDSPGLAKVLGIELNEDGFFRREDVMAGVVDSTRPGIFLAGYCMEPSDIPESVAQASAVAARAFAVIGGGPA